MAHDALLASAPEGTVHTDCQFCATVTAATQEPPVSNQPPAVIDQAALTAAAEAAARDAVQAVKAAEAAEAARVALEAERDALAGQVTELEAKLADVTAQAEYCTAEREQFRAEAAAATAAIEAAAAEADEAARTAAAEAARVARVDEVKATHLFSDSEVDDMADTLAAYDDDAYAKILDSYKAAAAKVTGNSNPLAARTGLDATASAGTKPVSAAASITALRYGQPASV